MIFSNWWFWIILISVIGLVIAIILFFATDINRLTVYILLGVFILLFILGIVFAIKSYRNPKKQNFGDKFIPFYTEARKIAEKTGMADVERKLRASTISATSAAARKVGRGGKYLGKTVWRDAKGTAIPMLKNAAVQAGIIIGSGGTLTAYAPVAGAAYQAKQLKDYRNKRRREDLERAQQLQQQQQIEQQQQIGGMPMDGQQFGGGMPIGGQQFGGGMPMGYQ